MSKAAFDIGAHYGQSIPQCEEDVIIYCFEPTPNLIPELEKVKETNPNIIIIQKAVSDFNGKTNFNIATDDGCSSLLEFSHSANVAWGERRFSIVNSIEVEVIRLDDFIEQNGITSIEYLHCDTQGNDLKVLKGMGKYISLVKEGDVEVANEGKPDILYHGHATIEECREFLESHGFTITGITNNDAQCNEVVIRFAKVP